MISIGCGLWDIPISLPIKRHLPCIRDQVMEAVNSEYINAIATQVFKRTETTYIRLNISLGHLRWGWDDLSRMNKLTSAYLLNRGVMDEAVRALISDLC